MIKEARDIPKDRLEIIANAAADTLDQTPIDAQILVTHNLDDNALVDYLLSRTGADGGNPALAGRDPENQVFPEKEQLIYRRILSHASQLIIELGFTGDELEMRTMLFVCNVSMEEPFFRETSRKRRRELINRRIELLISK